MPQLLRLMLQHWIKVQPFARSLQKVSSFVHSVREVLDTAGMHSLMSFRQTTGFLSKTRQKLLGVMVSARGLDADQVGQGGCWRRVSSISMGDGWWSREQRRTADDLRIYPFTVKTTDEEIEELHARLDWARLPAPLEDSRFHYGFNPFYLQKVVSYWRNQFDWKKQVDVLNRYPHFKTKIEGLNVHFVHCKPSSSSSGKPLMLLHGWPGSFYEFYWILPLLLDSQDNLAFEVVCPSIPGYGYSDAPELQGFDTLAAARIFLKLMERLGYSEFYLQGGDWGAIIATNMAQMSPKNVKGLHLNMFPVTNGGPVVLLSLLLGSRFPSLVGFGREDVRRLYPFTQRYLYKVLRETGYLHLQATKPDTAGCGLNDSPVGLAAYILEKFSCWTDAQNVHLHDGGLERKFSLDDLLTNIMIYWTTGSIVSSMRFYKENFKGNVYKRVDARTGVYVPTGLAAFPEDLLHCPLLWARQKYKNIVCYTHMPSGGHFAALEVPQLLVNDIRQFVEKVEALKK